MQYRRFGSLRWEASCLGFGCMRLPVLDGDYTRIDVAAAVPLLRHAIENGVNYFDTAYGYHGGNSEAVLAQALRGGYRDRVRIATKLPSWLVQDPSDFDRFLDEQRARLDSDVVDFYLLHALDLARWDKLHQLGVLDWAARALADGRIGHLGFSFHDDYAAFQQIVDAFDWTLCQIQYNYMDADSQAGTRGLRYAAAKGLAVVVMGPLLGGSLVDPPPAIQALWDAAPVRRSPADWALQWVWNQPEVSVVLSGMSAMDQLTENLKSADAARPGRLTEDELLTIEQVREVYRQKQPIPCTACRYCMPCPNGVDIPGNLRIYNQVVMYDKPSLGRNWWYQRQLSEPSRAIACVDCDQCEPKCPQHIPISDWMPRIHAVLAEGQDYTNLPD
jgi:predicted aldo/keto reductase-like oxidoreductase